MVVSQLSTAPETNVFTAASSLLPGRYTYTTGVTLADSLQNTGVFLTTASSQAVAVINSGGAGFSYSSTASSIVNASTSLTVASHAIAFITADVLDADILIKGLQPGVEVYVLPASELAQTIQQITQILARHTGITSLQLFSHGSDGSLQLGKDYLNSSDLATYSSAIHAWSSALAPAADILLYGCNVAASDAGKAFVRQISLLTGADVAASTDLTGDRALGGDWILEFQTGAIETPAVLHPLAQTTYHHVLATFTANNLNDAGAGSLRQAILDANAAPGADTIVFADTLADQTPDTITLTSGQLTLSGDLTIAGPGSGLLTINGNNTNRVFQINSTVNATIAGVNITNGNAADVGGGILNNGGSLALLNSAFNNNMAAQVGGSIANFGSMLVNGGSFTNNRAINGGAIYNAGGLEVRNSNFNTNQANGNGGGIYNEAGASLTVDNDYLSRNSAGGDGGSIYNRSGGTLNVLTTVIVDGSAGRLGGGIANFGTIAVLDNSLLQGNRSTGAGGAAGGVFNGGTANITNTSILNNTAAGSGGGIYNNGGAILTVRANSLVSGNRGSSGGGIYNLGTATVGESSILSNRTNAANGLGPDVFGSFISEGFNTIYRTSGSTGFSADLGDTIIFS